MRFILEIQCDNAAFGEDDATRGIELARILRHTANRLAATGFSAGSTRKLSDVNGNTVGSFELSDG